MEVHLAEQHKDHYLKMVQDIPKLANFAVVRQARHLPYGNGTPILAVKNYLDEGEPFVYMFGDDLVLSRTPCVKQLVDVYQKYDPDAVIAFQQVPHEEIRHYASAKLKSQSEPREIISLVEKPKPEEAASDLGSSAGSSCRGRSSRSWRSCARGWTPPAARNSI